MNFPTWFLPVLRKYVIFKLGHKERKMSEQLNALCDYSSSSEEDNDAEVCSSSGSSSLSVGCSTSSDTEGTLLLKDKSHYYIPEVVDF